MKPDAHAAWLPAPRRGARHGPAAPGRPPCRAGRVTQGGVVVGGIARQPEEDGPQLLTALVHDLEDRARRRPSRPAGPGVPGARGTGSRPLAGPMGRAVGLKSHGSCRSERGSPRPPTTPSAVPSSHRGRQARSPLQLGAILVSAAWPGRSMSPAGHAGLANPRGRGPGKGSARCGSAPWHRGDGELARARRCRRPAGGGRALRPEARGSLRRASLSPPPASARRRL